MGFIQNALASLEAQSFGLGLPLLSPLWTNVGNFTAQGADGMTLNNSGNWLAPISGSCQVIDPNPTPLAGESAQDAQKRATQFSVTLVKADGTAETGPGILLTVLPQAYLR